MSNPARQPDGDVAAGRPREDSRAAVRRRISRFEAGDQAAVLEPDGLAAARRLAALIGDGDPALPDLAAFHYCRFLAVPEDEEGPEFLAACRYYARAYPGAPRSGPPDLRPVLMALAGDPAAGAGPDAPRLLSNAGVKLLAITEMTGDLAGAEAACTCLRAAVAAAGNDDPSRPDYLINLAMALMSRFEELGERDDIDGAVAAAAEAVTLAGSEAGDLALFCSGLAAALTSRAAAFGDEADLRQAIEAGRRATAATHRDHPRYAGRTENLAAALLERCQRTGNLADIEAARAAAADAVAATAPDDPAIATRLDKVATALAIRWEAAGDPGDLDQAVVLHRHAIAAMSPERPDLSIMLLNLAGVLSQRFEHGERGADLDAAIEAGQAALARLPEGHPARPAALHNLATCLVYRAELNDGAPDLEAAVAAGSAALGLLPRGHAERPAAASGLGTALLARYEHSGDPVDLDRAADLLADVLRTAPAGPPEHAGWLINYGNVRLHQFRRSLALEDADDAIRLYGSALAATPPASSERAARLENLAVGWRLRAEHTGQPEDLDQAVAAAENLLARLGDDHPRRGAALASLANVFLLRLERTGLTADADRAVAAAAQAASLPAVRPDLVARALRDVGLANALVERAQHTGSSADSEQAIELIRAALAVIPPDHASYPGRLINLAYVLLEQADRLDPSYPGDEGPLPLLDEAVSASAAGTRLMPPGDEDFWMAAAAHGNALLARYQHARDPADLGASIEAYEVALRALPDGHPDRAGQLANLGGARHLRFQAEGGVADLNAAIDQLRMAVRGSDPAHPDTAKRQLGLGQALASIPGPVGSRDVLAEAVGNLSGAAGNAAALPAARITAAQTWGRMAAQAGDWGSAVAGYATAVALLPVAAWHGLSRDDREHRLSAWPGVARDAAACALQAGQGELAVELLEQGRSVLWSQALGTRTDLTRLAASHPELAERLAQARRVLEQVGQGPPLGAQLPDADLGLAASPLVRARLAGERRMRAAREWDDVVATVRTLPGFADFQQPVEFAQLRRAASEGPVVIVNASRIRCDALIITLAGVQVVPLERVTWDEVLEHGDAYLHAIQRLSGYGDQDPDREEAIARLTAIVTTLRWLWDTIAEPVLATLGHEREPAYARWPRVWWSATGPLSMLPLHAAGHDRPEPDGSWASVLDRVVSSYTPTLGALIRARERPVAAAAAGRRLLVVTMPAAPADSGLRPCPVPVRRPTGWPPALPAPARAATAPRWPRRSG